MITAMTTDKKRVIIGLSPLDLDRLRRGEAISLHMDKTLPIQILLFGGPSDQAMALEIAEFAGPGTVIDRRLVD